MSNQNWECTQPSGYTSGTGGGGGGNGGSNQASQSAATTAVSSATAASLQFGVKQNITGVQRKHHQPKPLTEKYNMYRYDLTTGAITPWKQTKQPHQQQQQQHQYFRRSSASTAASAIPVIQPAIYLMPHPNWQQAAAAPSYNYSNIILQQQQHQMPQYQPPPITPQTATRVDQQQQPQPQSMNYPEQQQMAPQYSQYQSPLNSRSRMMQQQQQPQSVDYSPCNHSPQITRSKQSVYNSNYQPSLQQGQQSPFHSQPSQIISHHCSLNNPLKSTYMGGNGSINTNYNNTSKHSQYSLDPLTIKLNTIEKQLDNLAHIISQMKSKESNQSKWSTTQKFQNVNEMNTLSMNFKHDDSNRQRINHLVQMFNSICSDINIGNSNIKQKLPSVQPLSPMCVEKDRSKAYRSPLVVVNHHDTEAAATPEEVNQSIAKLNALVGMVRQMQNDLNQQMLASIELKDDKDDDKTHIPPPPAKQC